MQVLLVSKKTNANLTVCVSICWRWAPGLVAVVAGGFYAAYLDSVGFEQSFRARGDVVMQCRQDVRPSRRC